MAKMDDGKKGDGMKDFMENLTESIAERIAGFSCDGGNRNLVVAIDGRCASGKTTLAAQLKKFFEEQKKVQTAVFHMDDFFLRPEQRTVERYEEPGGNVDRERVRDEILLPFRNGAENINYRPFNCQTMALGEWMKVRAAKINIVEGSYSCHPDLWDLYDLHVFLTVSPEEQKKRIQIRNGEAKAMVFEKRWIPLEEKYFSAFKVKERCEINADTSQGFEMR